MYLIFLIIFISFFFPILIFPLSIFALMMFLILPFKFTIDSFFNLFTVPKQIYQIATNPILRKNHALEHATINILEKEFNYNGLAGYAEENGFYIMGVESPLYVEEAAQKGLKLLKNGKKELAIHKRCGTSMTVANFLSAIIFLFLLFYSGNFSIINMIIALVISNILGPFVGQFVQKNFTISPEVEEMEIEGADYSNENYFINQRSKIFIKTTQIPYISQE
ncbi:MAG: DUF6391 domain-containing protein [Bacillota bacterium]